MLLSASCQDGKDRPEMKADARQQQTDPDKLHDELQPSITDTVFVGDLNNDGISDTAFVYTPRTIASVDQDGRVHFESGCEQEPCFNAVRFSTSLPELHHRNSVWGVVENAGDLNDDGYSELLFCPGWFTSNWTTLYLYTFKEGAWQQCSEVEYWREDSLSLRDHIKRKNGKYYLLGTDMFDGDQRRLEVEIRLR
jgi:hypothetical protein